MSEQSMDVERLVQEFLALVHIDSPPRQEGRIMNVIAPQLEAMGFKVAFDRAGEAVGGDVGNLIATLPATDPKAPSIALSAHVDTVEPTPNIRTIVENGMIRTDGTTILGADDKAAVAAIMEAARYAVASNIPHGEIQILLSICEEIGLKGAVEMDLSMVSAKMAFVFDTGLPVSGLVVHSPSHDRIRATIHGRKAHAGAAPENGINAIQAAATGIARMKLGRIDVETTANVGIIHGGEATNIIPDRVEIEAEARSRSEEKLTAQVAHMVDCIEGGAAECGGRADVKV
ncbi:MAG: M20/M25/M40 family metallo-hydrolase, partial [Armatimonadota bacterium]|nr:M20/M25/M40 family metallo-hydrolase [Armatimonadota bacterium]